MIGLTTGKCPLVDRHYECLQGCCKPLKSTKNIVNYSGTPGCGRHFLFESCCLDQIAIF